MPVEPFICEIATGTSLKIKIAKKPKRVLSLFLSTSPAQNIGLHI